MVAKNLLARNQNLKNLDIKTYEIFLIHHINVLNRLKDQKGRISDENNDGDGRIWWGCMIENELKVLEDELVDIILLVDDGTTV